MAEYDSSWYRPVEFILLLLSTLLQIVSISLPWWSIHKHAERPLYGYDANATLEDLFGNVANTTESLVQTTNETLPEEEWYIGIFYSSKCNASVCETKTLHDRHLERISNSGTTNDPVYEAQIMEQATVMIVFVITLVCIVFQVRMLRSRYSQFLFTTVSNGVWLSFAGGLMIRQLMTYYVDTNANLEKSRAEEYFSIILPYCVLLYTIAFLFTTLIVLLYVIEVCRIKIVRNKEEQLLKSDDVAMAPTGTIHYNKSSWSSFT